MKKLNIYDKEKKLDKAWFDSSNIIYAECIDNTNDLKTVTIVFKNGTQYLYSGVNVNDWLLFREAESQGKSISKYISKKNPITKEAIYKYHKLQDADLDKINEEYNKAYMEKYGSVNLSLDDFIELINKTLLDLKVESINGNDFIRTMQKRLTNNGIKVEIPKQDNK